MRREFDELAAIVHAKLQKDPFSGQPSVPVRLEPVVERTA